jgi:hypothetical protein
VVGDAVVGATVVGDAVVGAAVYCLGSIPSRVTGMVW